jgi:TctA family transporter
MLWYPALLGVLAGSVSGLIPGVGNFVLMLLLYPFLGSLSINELIIFYSSMATISQYIGSIPATLYGIPGE